MSMVADIYVRAYVNKMQAEFQIEISSLDKAVEAAILYESLSIHKSGKGGPP